MTITASRFTGDTAACFSDFNENHPHLRASELLADFCQTNVAVVQRWRNGEYFPTGKPLLHLRCFLVLAGYEVTEVRKLRGEVQQVAMLVGIGIITPEKAANSLGYNSRTPLNSLWRIILAGGGFNKDVRDKLALLHKKHKGKLESQTVKWQDRIVKVIGERVRQVQPPLASPQIDFSTIATAFGRTVTTAIALGTALLDAGQEQAIREATRGGQDLAELANILQQLSAKQ